MLKQRKFRRCNKSVLVFGVPVRLLDFPTISISCFSAHLLFSSSIQCLQQSEQGPNNWWPITYQNLENFNTPGFLPCISLSTSSQLPKCRTIFDTRFSGSAHHQRAGHLDSGPDASVIEKKPWPKHVVVSHNAPKVIGS